MTYVGGIAKEQLRSFLQRIEKLEEEKAQVAEGIKEIYAEARSAGFDVSTLKKVVRLAKVEVQKRQEQEELLDLYMEAVGMIPSSAPVEEVV